MTLRFVFHYPETTGSDGDPLDSGALDEVARATEAAGFDALALTEHPILPVIRPVRPPSTATAPAVSRRHAGLNGVPVVRGEIRDYRYDALPMTQPHASGPRAEAKRTLLLDAAEKVMLEKGYAGVTSRSIGAAADMPAPLVHYYYPTLDDLFVALLKRGVERSTKAFLAAVESPKPLRAVWQFHLQTRGASLTMELVALSAHRPAVRTALMEISREFQELQVEQLGQLLERYAVDPNVFPPELATLAIGGIARDIVREKVIGVTVGHDVALEAITRLIERIEGVETPAQRRPRRVRPLSVPSN